jgi:hypothetical protein
MTTSIGMAFVAELNKNKMLIMSVFTKAGPLRSAFYRHYFKMKNNYERPKAGNRFSTDSVLS